MQPKMQSKVAINHATNADTPQTQLMQTNPNMQPMLAGERNQCRRAVWKPSNIRMLQILRRIDLIWFVWTFQALLKHTHSFCSFCACVDKRGTLQLFARGDTWCAACHSCFYVLGRICQSLPWHTLFACCGAWCGRVSFFCSTLCCACWCWCSPKRHSWNSTSDVCGAEHSCRTGLKGS